MHYDSARTTSIPLLDPRPFLQTRLLRNGLLNTKTTSTLHGPIYPPRCFTTVCTVRFPRRSLSPLRGNRASPLGLTQIRQVSSWFAACTGSAIQRPSLPFDPFSFFHSPRRHPDCLQSSTSFAASASPSPPFLTLALIRTGLRPPVDPLRARHLGRGITRTSTGLLVACS